MNLPIVEGMLRGGLRPNLLRKTLSEKELMQNCRILRKISSNENLKEIENVLVEVLLPMGLIKLREAFSQQHAMILSAEKFPSFNGFGSRKYTPAQAFPSFDGVLEMPSSSNPFHRFYALLVDAELIRMKKLMHDLCLTLRNDCLMRNELKDLLKRMAVYCQEAAQWESDSEIMRMIAAKLTQSYFELLGSYHNLLYQGEDVGLIDDFCDFVYLWRREDPNEEEMERFTDVSCKAMKAEPTSQFEHQTENVQEVQKCQTPNDVNAETDAATNKYDTFLAALNGQSTGFPNYGFFNLPKISCLNSEQQKKLISDIAFRETDHVAFAVAMLCFLEYDTKLISEYGFNKTHLYKYWGKLLNVNERKIGGNYQTVRNADTTEDKDLYKAHKYFDEEAEKIYHDILDEKS